MRHVAALHQDGSDDRHPPHVFVIENTQNRDGEAMQSELGELIRVAEGEAGSPKTELPKTGPRR
jgi:hypothetical protein